MTDRSPPSSPPAESRWIDAVDVRLGLWLTVAAVVCGSTYMLATWSEPHRAAMVSLMGGGLVSTLVIARSWPWLLRSQRRAELFFPGWSLGYLALITILCGLDGGVHSPVRAFFFVPVAYATLAYPLRPAALVAASSLVCFLALAVFQGGEWSSIFVFAVALACTGALGSRQAWRERRRRAEIIAQRDSLSQSEQRFRAGFEHSPVGMAMISTDGHYVQVNEALCRLLGRPRSWIEGRSFLEVTHPDDAENDLLLVNRILNGELDHHQHEKRYLDADGLIVHALVGESVIRDGDGRILYFYSQVIDITPQRASADRAQRRARQQAVVAAVGQRALEGAPLSELLDESVAAMQDTLGVPFADASELLGDGRLVARATCGWEPGFTTSSDPATSQAGLTLSLGRPVLVEDSATEDRFVPELAREFGLVSALSVPVPAPDGGFWGVLAASSAKQGRFDSDDVSFLQALANVLAGALSREAAERRLRHLSLHDALTGLPNRTLLLDRLAHALARTQRTSEVLAVMFLDVDHFKTVNDAFGHGTGDELLRALTPRLRGALRLGDTLARFGGDEFVVLCEGLHDAEGAQALAERLLAVFATPFILGRDAGHPTEHHLSASIGIALAGDDHVEDPDALIRDADIAMYRAKQGRGRVELFDTRTRDQVVERVRTTSELRRALDENELHIAYQPIVDLRDGSVRRLEALLRWRHPERGLVSPDEFIPLAEESGLILPIGAWVLDQVARQLAAWDRHEDPRMRGLRSGVNLSARQLVEPGLIEVVTGALAAHGVANDRIVCEITETALIDDPVRASSNVLGLVEAGGLVALDDFCTGYSALEHLKRFPLAAIKLDRTFVADVATNTIDMAVVRGLVEMAGAMSLSTVAEGVENREQLARLRELGCQLAQGYLFSPAVLPSELEELVCSLPGGAFDLGAMHAAAC